MKKHFIYLMTLFMFATMLSSNRAYALDPGKSEYDAALAAITDGVYYLVTDVGGVKYYVTSQGGLTSEKDYGGQFTISKTSGGELYDIGFLIEPGTGSHFSNTTLIDGKANLHPGSFCLNAVYNRNNWERQVFFLNIDGKYAIRTSNSSYDTSCPYFGFAPNISAFSPAH